MQVALPPCIRLCSFSQIEIWLTDYRDQYSIGFRRLVFCGRQGLNMEQAVRVFDQQYLVQTAVDLRNRRAEIETLRDSIRAAEASKRSRSVRGTSIALSGRASPSQLVLTAD